MMILMTGKISKVIILIIKITLIILISIIPTLDTKIANIIKVTYLTLEKKRKQLLNSKMTLILKHWTTTICKALMLLKV